MFTENSFNTKTQQEMAIPSTCLDDKCLGTSKEKMIFPKTEISNLDLSDGGSPFHQSNQNSIDFSREQNLPKKPSMNMCRICLSTDSIHG